MFRGKSTVSMDAKGRVSIPVKHRAALSRMVIVPNPNRQEPCLFIYHEDEWEKIEADIVARPNTESIRKLKRIFLGEAEDYMMDTNGRILLTAELRKAANLGKKLVLVGQGNKLEIWDEPVWQSMAEEDNQEAFLKELETFAF